MRTTLQVAGESRLFDPYLLKYVCSEINIASENVASQANASKTVCREKLEVESLFLLQDGEVDSKEDNITDIVWVSR